MVSPTGWSQKLQYETIASANTYDLGEVEFVLSIIKVTATIGFILLAIIIDCGGVPTDNRGYIGAKYWHDPGAFRNGFKGFCSVFITAAFSFTGTELTGLAAAEAANPMKSIPSATKQVFWRISIFYVLGLFMIGLIVRSDDDRLLNASGAHTAFSPFIIAISDAGIKVLPSIFNAVITISVLSVANSCTFGSTRTMQALAQNGMGPRFLAKVDKHGRPTWCVVIQLLFGLLAFVNEAGAGSTFFNWLLALSGLSSFFIWGSICLAHIRFRAGWLAQGHTLSELPYRASFGVIGSGIGLLLNILCLIASFYVALFPIGGSPDPSAFFQQYLAAPLIFALYLFWKVLYGRRDPFFIRAKDMGRSFSTICSSVYLLTEIADVTTGIRANIEELQQMADEKRANTTAKGLPLRIIRAIF